MVAHPILIERPIVETPNGVRLCRPQDRVREILYPENPGSAKAGSCSAAANDG